MLACTLKHISLTGTSFTTTTGSTLYVICFIFFYYLEHRWGTNCLFPRSWSFTLWQLLFGSQRLLGTLRVWLTWYIQVWLDKDWRWVEFSLLPRLKEQSNDLNAGRSWNYNIAALQCKGIFNHYLVNTLHHTTKQRSIKLWHTQGMNCVVKFAKGIAMKWGRLQEAAKKSNCYVTDTRLFFGQSLISQSTKNASTRQVGIGRRPEDARAVFHVVWPKTTTALY